MQDKERELEEFEASHTLGGAGEGRVIALRGAFFLIFFHARTRLLASPAMTRV
jgi:hypothetical protein